MRKKTAIRSISDDLGYRSPPPVAGPHYFGLPRTRSALWLALGRRVFGLMTLIREIALGFKTTVVR